MVGKVIQYHGIRYTVLAWGYANGTVEVRTEPYSPELLGRLREVFTTKAPLLYHWLADFYRVPTPKARGSGPKG
jgi:hypothetical protein